MLFYKYIYGEGAYIYIYMNGCYNMSYAPSGKSQGHCVIWVGGIGSPLDTHMVNRQWQLGGNKLRYVPAIYDRMILRICMGVPIHIPTLHLYMCINL